LVKLLSYTISPTFTIQFIPSTQYDFLIKFTFNGIYTVPDFSYSVQINPKFATQFTSADMAQRKVVTVTSALLALKD
jgi:hypothetical protein